MHSALLAGHTALVTGASRGIGAAIARKLGMHGANVAVNYRHNAQAAAAVVADIQASGSRAVAVQADASDYEQVEAMMATTAKHLGDPDLLVCNVMVGSEQLGARIGSTLGSFVDSLDGVSSVKDAVVTQLDTVLACCHLAVPGMRRRGGGSIVLIGASATHNAKAVLPEIVIAKSTQDAVARCLAQQLGPDNIRVNTVAPGFVPTDSNAGPNQGAVAERIAAASHLPEPISTTDVADVVSVLVSPLCRKTTGLFIPLDGGQTIV